MARTAWALTLTAPPTLPTRLTDCRFETPAAGSEALAWGRETNETTYTLYTRVAVPRYARVVRAKDGLTYAPQGPGVEQGVGSGIWSVAVKLEAR